MTSTGIGQRLNNGRILLNQENRDIFSASLKQKFLEIDNNNKTNDGVNNDFEHVHSSLLIPIIHKVLKTCERYCIRKRAANTFSTNLWYDQKCKAAKRSIKGKDMKIEVKKKYAKLIQTEKEEYVNTRRRELISLIKHNPKYFCKELQ